MLVINYILIWDLKELIDYYQANFQEYHEKLKFLINISIFIDIFQFLLADCLINGKFS